VVVDAAPIEPISPSADSLITGKLTGNLGKSDPCGRFLPLIDEFNQWLAAKFPANMNREFSEA
jgi:hypothetical protein